MDSPKLSAIELRRRYRQGERNFANTDLSDESLRGLDLQGINLSGADLSNADLRGTNFTNAKLIHANLRGAKTGILRIWVLQRLLDALILVAFSSFVSAAAWASCANLIFDPNGSHSSTNTIPGDLLGGFVGIGILTGILLLIYFQGTLVVSRMAFIAILLLFLGNTSFITIVALAFAAVVVAVSGFALAIAIAGDIAGNIAFAFAVVVAFAVAIAGNLAAFATSAVAVAVAGTITTSILSYSISFRALKGDSRDKRVRDVVVWYASRDGTQFKRADLTNANCSQATLKTANFYGATLTHTSFHLAKQVNLARLGKTILSDFAVQELLITLKGAGKSYIGSNLKGAYLAKADLADANFTEADLSQAILKGANLQRVNFTKTQALGTQFQHANLTAACLESWNIDSTTQLENVICKHVYLLNHHQERRPSSGIFQPGEFTKLFEEVLDTIDLIFQNGIDWKAFLQTFRQVQVEHEGAELSIQSIENKGDGVVVVKLHAAPGTDKGAVHELFMSGYQTAFQEAEARYRAQLHAKDDEIQYHRQQNANMQEVVKLLAARPINIDVKATAESKAMQGNDQSQKFNVQGDFTINAKNSVVSLREISGQVSNQISQLSTDSTSDQPSLKDLLTKLQQAVEADTELDDGKKTEALAEVGELASAAQKPKEGVMQKAAKRAMNALKGITAGLSDVSKLASACKELMPLIMTAFGLP